MFFIRSIRGFFFVLISDLSEGDSSETAREIERIPSYITDWPGSDKTYISRLVVYHLNDNDLKIYIDIYNALLSNLHGRDMRDHDGF